MIARNDRRIAVAHQTPGRLARFAVARQSRLPACVPIKKCGLLAQVAVGHLAADQSMEGIGKVGPVGLHPVEQILTQGGIHDVLAEQAQFTAHHGQPFLIVQGAIALDAIRGDLDGCVHVVVDTGQQGFGKTAQVPLGNGGLVAVGIATLMVNGTEHGVWIVGIHKGAGAVINGLAAQRHVVGVQYTVDKAHPHPLDDQ